MVRQPVDRDPRMQMARERGARFGEHVRIGR